MRPRPLPIALLLLLAGAAAALAWRQLRPVAVRVVHAHRGLAIEAVYATGTVEPTVAVPIAPRVAGRLVELAVDEGMRVRRGQRLARLEDANLRQALGQLEAQARLGQQTLERARRLQQQGLGSVADRDKALADAEAADAAVARAREELAFMTLSAPAAGLIIRRDGEIGQYIAVNQPIFQMQADGRAPLRISAEVDEEDIAEVAVGQAVVIHADAFPEQVFDGSVIEITPAGNVTTRSFRVRIGLGADTPLRVGMTVDANIVIGRHDNALLVPASALAGSQVWVVRDQRLVPVTVRTGVRGASGVEVLAGLEERDAVVDAPAADLRAGRRVRLVPPRAATALSAGPPGGG
ncbi:MAG: efflux RND transporter periplasmic adaptor subunit [Gammaproteobacteria bacterium]|nr:efflux RND transporter periplasmic adaptor subunit [Gammaproteobacteria bacterium]